MTFPLADALRSERLTPLMTVNADPTLNLLRFLSTLQIRSIWSMQMRSVGLIDCQYRQGLYRSFGCRSGARGGYGNRVAVSKGRSRRSMSRERTRDIQTRARRGFRLHPAFEIPLHVRDPFQYRIQVQGRRLLMRAVSEIFVHSMDEPFAVTVVGSLGAVDIAVLLLAGIIAETGTSSSGEIANWGLRSDS